MTSSTFFARASLGINDERLPQKLRQTEQIPSTYASGPRRCVAIRILLKIWTNAALYEGNDTRVKARIGWTGLTVKIEAPNGGLAKYSWNRKVRAYYRCKKCGCITHYACWKNRPTRRLR